MAIAAIILRVPRGPRRPDLGRCTEHIERTRRPSTSSGPVPRRFVTRSSASSTLVTGTLVTGVYLVGRGEIANSAIGLRSTAVQKVVPP